MHEKTLNNLPPLSESAIQEQIVDLLSRLATAGRLFFFSVPNERSLDHMPKPKKYARLNKLKRMGMVPGVSDLVVVWRGRAYFLEVKTRRGVMSDAQRHFAITAERCGSRCAVVHDADEVLACLRAWRILSLDATVRR